MLSTQDVARVVLIGVGATAVMDVWLLLLKRAGVQTANFALVGRWVGHMRRGHFAHPSIAKAPPIRGELQLGWLVHYLVGVGFAWLLVTMYGVTWIRQPAFVPALITGVGTVVAPLFVMQPAMGAGIAGAKTQAPLNNVVRSLANHAVFGTGLYLAAATLGWIT